MIIFAGRSNVGKSTLIFRLTGKFTKRGKRPGVTRKPVEIGWRNKKIIDLPGFGFMSGVPKHVQEKIKTDIIHFIENNTEDIELAVLVIDGKSTLEIIERWEKRGEIPIDVEFFQFLQELEIPTIVAVNKLDKMKNVEATINKLIEKFGLNGTWEDYKDVFIPISAKFGTNVEELKRVIIQKSEERKRD
ncbi:GTP-binding protein EngB [Palaeococcus pacificus DY20341]|uniref:Probable GTP-binding protein EngB n=1 Tax=Palaeococcus pacificus DY20341 TaxID=1343739 RepID=A0A075LUL9_9EURY|nr:GTP-binding protein EngB [Palaeococcus pacificus]AIF70425.1 GTP-binding protein EngB [Palaeococcus pacificus DY20341]